jgi:hypothetical protein
LVTYDHKYLIYAMQNSPCGTPQAHRSDLSPVKYPTGVTDSPTGVTDSPTGVTDSPTGVTDSPTGVTDSPLIAPRE